MRPPNQNAEDVTETETPVFDILRPQTLTSPVVFASPHSGRRYPAEFLEMSKLDRQTIRRSEDAFIDELFSPAAEFGAPLLRAHFPRAYVDASREPFELDPAMFSAPLPDWVNAHSPRVSAGLGSVAKIVAGGAEIYNGPLDFDEVQARIKAHYVPYHQALETLINDAVEVFGCCLVIDCHSMPSLAVPNFGRPHPDVVLGDCHGSSCNGDISRMIETSLRDIGLSVIRNKPYAGGHTTRHYSRPTAGVQTIQIEINRALYMDETDICRHAGFAQLAERLRLFIAHVASLDAVVLRPPLAAE